MSHHPFRSGIRTPGGVAGHLEFNPLFAESVSHVVGGGARAPVCGVDCAEGDRRDRARPDPPGAGPQGSSHSHTRRLDRPRRADTYSAQRRMAGAVEPAVAYISHYELVLHLNVCGRTGTADTRSRHGHGPPPGVADDAVAPAQSQTGDRRAAARVGGARGARPPRRTRRRPRAAPRALPGRPRGTDPRLHSLIHSLRAIRPNRDAHAKP